MDIHSIILAATEAVQAAAPAASEAAVAAAETSHEADTGLLGTLGINFKLLVAQLFNFAIVLFVFWKWIVGPLGKALTDRQDRIESGLKNATYMEEEKRKFEAWKSEQMSLARTEAEKVMRNAAESSEKLRAEVAASTQEQAAKMIEQAKAAIGQEKDQAMREARQDIADLVIMASEKVIKAKLDDAKDHELVAAAVKGLK